MFFVSSFFKPMFHLTCFNIFFRADPNSLRPPPTSGGSLREMFVNFQLMKAGQLNCCHGAFVAVVMSDGGRSLEAQWQIVIQGRMSSDLSVYHSMVRELNNSSLPSLFVENFTLLPLHPCLIWCSLSLNVSWDFLYLRESEWRRKQTQSQRLLASGLIDERWEEGEDLNLIYSEHTEPCSSLIEYRHIILSFTFVFIWCY